MDCVLHTLFLCACSSGTPNQRTWEDDWTVVDVNGALSAQFEHTVLITQQGVEVLTIL